ncbi:Ig-like domain-containing protein [Flavitalea flava]
MKKSFFLLFYFLCMALLQTSHAQQLTYKTSWIANTFPGGDSYSTDPAKAHVQNYIQNFWVNRDGTDGKVFTTATWDEGDREKSIIQNAQVIGRMPDPGHNVQHDAITGDGTFIYIAQVIDRGNWVTNGYGLRRYNLDGSSAPMSNGVGNDKSYIEVQASGTDLTRIATSLAVNTSSKELYYSDPVDGKIKVLDLNTNTVVASFTISGIAVDNNRLAVATDGYLWWLVRQDKKIYRYSNRGAKQSQEITGIQDPSAICIDKNNNLYVTDNGTSLQIRLYNNINSSPAFQKTIGDNNGIYGGSKGVVGDMKFHPGMAGLGTDANGNIYLATNGVDNGTGTILKSINPAGTALNWQVYGLAFVDCFDVDPSNDGLDIYGRTEHFKMDFTRNNGKEWSYQGYTLDKFTNTGDGVRGDGTSIIRNRDGRKFMYTIGMTSGGFNLYRFDPAPSEIAVPIGSINRDTGWGWDVDNNCDVWSGGAGGKIRRYAYPGINLNYNTSSPDEWNIPAPFNAVERVKYIADSDILYISGWSNTYPNSKNDWGRIGRIICRYNNWKGGNRTANVTTVLDYTNQEAPKAFDIAGDYAFVTACKEEKTWVYATANGSMTGILTPGPEVNSKSGWVDIAYGTRAFKRSNGEYLILNEEDLFGKVIMYRWCPSGNCSVSNVPVASVIVSPVTGNINTGGTINLAATISPGNATNKTVSWSSSNTNVATVNSSGVATGVAPGTATITVTTQDGNKTASSVITVQSGGSSTKLNGTVITNVDPYGSGVGNNAFDNNTTTFVDAKQTSGAYVGLDFGSAQGLGSIRFFPRSGQEARMNGGKFQGSNDGSNYTDLYTIGANPPAGWNTVTVSGSYRYFRYINNAANTYCNVAEIECWSSGSATVAVTGVTVSPTTVSVATGSTTSLSAAVSPGNATNQTVSWSSSNTAVASVNSSGVVTGLTSGTATITVTTQDGNKTATCAVTVPAAGATKFTGTVLTNVDPYGSGVGNNAFDGNTTTFVDAKQTSGAYVGLDFGSAKGLGYVKFFPRSGQEARMNGGKFQGSNDGSNYTDLYTIGANPPAGWNTVTVSGSYRYFRYINNAANTYCNVAEIECWSTGTAPSAVANGTSVNTGASFEERKPATSFYPNPAKDFVNLTFSTEDEGQGQVELVTLDGRVIKNQSFSYKKGVNTIKVTFPTQSGNILLTYVKAGKVNNVYKLMIQH